MRLLLTKLLLPGPPCPSLASLPVRTPRRTEWPHTAKDSAGRGNTRGRVSPLASALKRTRTACLKSSQPQRGGGTHSHQLKAALLLTSFGATHEWWFLHLPQTVVGRQHPSSPLILSYVAREISRHPRDTSRPLFLKNKAEKQVLERHLILYFPARQVHRGRGHRRPVRQAPLSEHAAAERPDPLPFHDFLPLLQHRRLRCVVFPGPEQRVFRERAGGGRREAGGGRGHFFPHYNCKRVSACRLLHR